MDRFGLTQPLTTNWNPDPLSFSNFLLSLQLLAWRISCSKQFKQEKIRKVKTELQLRQRKQSWLWLSPAHIFDISGNPMVMASASNSSPTKSFLCWFQFSLWCLSVILKSNYFLLQARWPLQMTYWINLLFWSINKVVIIPNNSIHSAKSYQSSKCG